MLTDGDRFDGNDFYRLQNLGGGVFYFLFTDVRNKVGDGMLIKILWRLGFVILAGAFLFSFPFLRAEIAEQWFRVPTQGEDPLFDNSTLQKLYSIQVTINWDKIDIQKAVDDLSSQCNSLEGQDRVKFIIIRRPEKKIVYNRTGNSSAMGAILTFVLQNNMDVKIHKNAVILTPSSQKPPAVGL